MSYAAGGPPCKLPSRRQRTAVIVLLPPFAAGGLVAAQAIIGEGSGRLALHLVAILLCVWPVYWALVRSLASRRRRAQTTVLIMCFGTTILTTASYVALTVGAYIGVWIWLVVADDRIRLISVALVTIGLFVANGLVAIWRRLG